MDFKGPLAIRCPDLLLRGLELDFKKFVRVYFDLCVHLAGFEGRKAERCLKGTLQPNCGVLTWYIISKRAGSVVPGDRVPASVGFTFEQSTPLDVTILETDNCKAQLSTSGHFRHRLYPSARICSSLVGRRLMESCELDACKSSNFRPRAQQGSVVNLAISIPIQMGQFGQA